jgi:mono/diheme cytochrome c family protein
MFKRKMLALYIGVLFVALGLLMSGGTVLARPVNTIPVVAQSMETGDPCEALRTIPAASTSMSMDSMSMEMATPEATAAEGQSAEMGGHMLPSFPGDPGPALGLQGDPEAGAKILADNCQKCHGENGEGGVANPGSDEGVIPSLNPLDEDMFDPDPMVYVCILDLFVEHGSVPPGNPKETMPAWGDEGKLDPQQIADVLA